ncbi:hypothetical protein [Solidesulfovibrio sp.]
MPADARVTLEMPPDAALARVLTTAAEALAQRRGFGRRESLRFQLTVEEFFCYLACIVDPGQPIRIVLTARQHQMEAAFGFTAAALSLGALNLTSVASVDVDGEPSRDMGLLLAAKIADRFHLSHEGKTDFILEAEVDKVYPPASVCLTPVALRGPFTAGRSRDSGQLLHAAALAAATYPAWHCPGSFQTPGRFADMAEAGQVASVVACDAAGQVAGLMCWSASGEKGLHFSGPFVFAPGAEAGPVACLLVEAFLAAVAREGRDIVFSQRATADMPPGYFESLGFLDLVRLDRRCRQDVLFRHLREDAGTAVWCHPGLHDFLRQAYDALAMCRDILPVEPTAGRQGDRSLLSTAMDQKKNLAELKPLLDGGDMADNLAGHVRALTAKGIDNILFYMDLSCTWQAALADDLGCAGFAPRLVLPYAGRSDVVVYQYAPTH